MKKLLSLIMAMVLASALFGCGSPDSSSSGGDSAGGSETASSAEGNTGETKKLTMILRAGSYTDVMKNMAPAFGEEHNVEFEYLDLDVANMYEKIALNSKSNQGSYDVLMIDEPWFREFQETGIISNLSELGCELDDIVVFGADTDISPYDSGSYASSTAYLTGMAVVKTCESLKKKILKKAAEYLNCSEDELEFAGKTVRRLNAPEGEPAEITLKDIGNRAMCFNEEALQATESHSSPVSPPPFMAGAAEVEIDKETGHIELLQFAAAVDCGTPLNENLARVQTEGGLAQGIGMALYEDIQYNEKGQLRNNSFMQYKIPSRVDIQKIRVDFAPSYEKSHPFGAKSIGEIVINTPCPAIANAVYNAVGVRVREMPIKPEKIAMELASRERDI